MKNIGKLFLRSMRDLLGPQNFIKSYSKWLRAPMTYTLSHYSDPTGHGEIFCNPIMGKRPGPVVSVDIPSMIGRAAWPRRPGGGKLCQDRMSILGRVLTEILYEHMNMSPGLREDLRANPVSCFECRADGYLQLNPWFSIFIKSEKPGVEPFLFANINVRGEGAKLVADILPAVMAEVEQAYKELMAKPADWKFGVGEIPGPR